MGRLLGLGLAAHNDKSSVTMVVAAMVVGTFVLGCLCLTVVYVRVKSKRRTTRRRAYEDGSRIQDGVLQVIVLAHEQEAELEIQVDGFDTYEELRELVVDSVPQMFNDSDAILMEYADGNGFSRVKTKTPIEIVKRARSVRIKCQPDKLSKKIARRMPLRAFEPTRAGTPQTATSALHVHRSRDVAQNSRRPGRPLLGGAPLPRMASSTFRCAATRCEADVWARVAVSDYPPRALWSLSTV